MMMGYMAILINKVFWIIKYDFFSYGYPISRAWTCCLVAPHSIYSTMYLEIYLRINYLIYSLL